MEVRPLVAAALALFNPKMIVRQDDRRSPLLCTHLSVTKLDWLALSMSMCTGKYRPCASAISACAMDNRTIELERAVLAIETKGLAAGELLVSADDGAEPGSASEPTAEKYRSV